MPALSYALHADLINWLKGSAFPAAPSGLKLGLLTVAATPEGASVSEPSNTAGYARQDVTLGAITTAAGVSTVGNSAPMVFGPATADWAPVAHMGVFSAAGDLLFYSPLAAPRTCKAGDSISFGANALQLRLR